MTSQAEDLMRRVLNEGGDGYVAHQLLYEFVRGYPVCNIRRLLDNESSVWVGVWIAGELGSSACSVLPDVVRFLRHPAPRTRSDILGIVLVCAGNGDGQWICDAAHLIADENASVRVSAIDFLARLSPEQLASIGEDVSSDPVILQGLQWLALVEQLANDDVASKVKHELPVWRRIGAAAAIRKAAVAPSLLSLAISSSDSDIRDAALARADIRTDSTRNN